jgi:hypothetical protein
LANGLASSAKEGKTTAKANAATANAPVSDRMHKRQSDRKPQQKNRFDQKPRIT